MQEIVGRTWTNDLYAWSGVANGTRAYTSNGQNQYTAVAGASLTYDGNGNLTGDGEGRLRQMTLAGTVSNLLYDGTDLIAEYDAANALLRRYVHGPGVDEPLVWYEGAGTTSKTWLYADHQGSIVAQADATGTSTATYSYGPFGEPNQTTGSRFRYTGQQFLGPLNLYYYKARFYSPAIGRFLQTDPIGYADDLNLYAYVGNNPPNFSDPTGLAVGDWWDLPANIGRAREIASEELAKRPSSHNDLGDAMRHSEWMRRTTQETNTFTAWVAGTGHEIEGALKGQAWSEMTMDLHNNSVGRDAGRNKLSIDQSKLWTLPLNAVQYNPYSNGCRK